MVASDVSVIPNYDIIIARSEVVASDVSVIPNAVDSIRFRPLQSDEFDKAHHKQKSFARVRLKKDKST